MSMTIVKTGVCDTVQDKGRIGFAAFGINTSGAMDKLAMMTANALVANELMEAVIEMHYPASSFRFERDVLIALAGANFNAQVTPPAGNGIMLETNKTAFIKAGSVLSFINKISGERCYLAVHGGFRLAKWMGSYSTHLAVQQGGHKGRKLMKGDSIELNRLVSPKYNSFKSFTWRAGVHPWYHDAPTFNVLRGPEWDHMQPASQKKFLSGSFLLLAKSDRMGIRLEGFPLAKEGNSELVSSGTSFGCIQLLPDGQLIILMADHPTTGGYPRIANIISAHLPKLAQASPGSNIHFAITEMLNAEKMLLMQHKEMNQLQAAVRLQLGSLV